MGQRSSQFTEEELQDYQDLTYFTKKEVMHAHMKFKALAPEKVGHNRNAKLPMNKVLQYPELRVNPFGDRICKVFSTSQDGDCTFEDFLDMMSVFSDSTPKSVKAEHAFRIFDSIIVVITRTTTSPGFYIFTYKLLYENELLSSLSIQKMFLTNVIL
ncbi:unnamed protein product [Nezara viridula]|uniref:Uncharacterized protein n=1 Tax=Nezara viridula TaxID=85310 RepID=A0A9P0GWJ4_NEZVI|nr:unnamed protein product [Nezara viridula]